MHLEIEAELCTGCRICEAYCTLHHEGAIWPETSRVRVLGPDGGPFTPIVCRQCEDAACAAACPLDAIALDERTGAWVVDTESCIACGACVDACPYDAIFVDEARSLALKCDLCGGEPRCAPMCPKDVIRIVGQGRRHVSV